MPRVCQVCQSEYLQQVNACLRSGNKQSSIAAEYGLSEDSIQRHAQRHLNAAKANADASSLAEKWIEIYSRADEIFKASSTLGDARAALSALQQQASALESSTRLRSEKVGFESLTVQEKIARIKSDDELYRALFDQVLRQSDAYQNAEGYTACPVCSTGRVERNSRRLTQWKKDAQPADTVV